MNASLNVRNIVAGLMVAGLLLLPVYSALSGNVFVLTLFTRIVILALAAVSLNLIMGYGGMMSFGHAAYLGIGGFALRIPGPGRDGSRGILFSVGAGPSPPFSPGGGGPRP